MRELIDTFARPEFRGRAQFGWRIGGFEAITTLNYTDSYEDVTVTHRGLFDNRRCSFRNIDLQKDQPRVA